MNRRELDLLELGPLRAVVPTVTRVGRQVSVACPYGCPIEDPVDVPQAVALMVAHTCLEGARR